MDLKCVIYVQFGILSWLMEPAMLSVIFIKKKLNKKKQYKKLQLKIYVKNVNVN